MKKEEAINEINKVFTPAYANYIVTALTEGATVSDKEQEPKMGHWITHNESITLLTGETATGGVICSECGFKTHNKAHVVFGCPFKYCPNCGVKIAESEVII